MFLIQALINFIHSEWPMLLILYLSYKVLTLADWFCSLDFKHKKSGSVPHRQSRSNQY